MTEAARTTAGMLPTDAGRPARRAAAAMGPKEAVWLARYVCFLSLAFAGLGLLLLVLGLEHHGAPGFAQWAEDAVVAIGFSVLGVVIAPRFPPGNPIGWLFCAIGLVGAVLLFCGEYAAYSLVASPGSLPGGEEMAWVASWLWVAHIGLFVFLALLFPDGRPPSPRWRPFAWIVGAAVVLGSVAAAYSAGPVRGLGAVRNPLGMEGIPDLSGAIEVLVFVLALVAAVSLVARLRGARGVERLQIRWFAYAAAVAAVGAIVFYVISGALGSWWLHWEVGFAAMMVGVVGMPAALCVAVLRYRLHDIDLIVNRALVYGLLTAVLAGLFELNVVALQHVALVLTHVEDSQIAYFASALMLAALFEPLKRRIDRLVERRFFRRDPRPRSDRPTSENQPSMRSGE